MRLLSAAKQSGCTKTPHVKFLTIIMILFSTKCSSEYNYNIIIILYLNQWIGTNTGTEWLYCCALLHTSIGSEMLKIAAVSG